MIIKFNHYSFILEDLLKDDFLSKNAALEKHEKKVILLIRKWYLTKEHFEFYTSGSTSIAKKILIKREQIIYSTSATFHSIDKKDTIKSSLLCIHIDFIGGAMVVFRALIKKHHILRVLSPSKNPLDQLKHNEKYDLTSLVPIQFTNSSKKSLNKIKNILVGGANTQCHKDDYKPSHVYITFGMTETVSHFALRKVNEKKFYTVGDTHLIKNKDKILYLKGKITNYKTLKTNDLINFTSTHSFIWLGRLDFVINSGGIKVCPEQIEEILRSELTNDFVISSLPDDVLGEKIVLVQEGTTKIEFEFSLLEKYHRPKEVILMKQLPKTKSGKIDRLKVKKQLLMLENQSLHPSH